MPELTSAYLRLTVWNASHGAIRRVFNRQLDIVQELRFCLRFIVINSLELKSLVWLEESLIVCGEWKQRMNKAHPSDRISRWADTWISAWLCRQACQLDTRVKCYRRREYDDGNIVQNSAIVVIWVLGKERKMLLERFWKRIEVSHFASGSNFRIPGLNLVLEKVKSQLSRFFMVDSKMWYFETKKKLGIYHWDWIRIGCDCRTIGIHTTIILAAEWANVFRLCLSKTPR